MPRLTTPNSLYKFVTNKLCHPMRICVETSFWTVNKWYGIPCSKHNYFIEYRDRDIRIRYENDYWNEEVINKWKEFLTQ